MIRTILERKRDYFDQKEVMKSIYEKIQKEVRIDPNITLGDAVKNIWEDLDWKLVGTSQEHGANRVSAVRRALDKLGICETDRVLASAYLNSR